MATSMRAGSARRSAEIIAEQKLDSLGAMACSSKRALRIRPRNGIAIFSKRIAMIVLVDKEIMSSVDTTLPVLQSSARTFA